MSSGSACMKRLRLGAISAVLTILCLQLPTRAITGPAVLAVLRVGQPVENPAYRLGTSTTVRLFVENQGPSASVNGALFVYFTRPTDVMGGMKNDPSQNMGLTNGNFCEKQAGSYATQARCPFDQLNPGERMYVLVRVYVEPQMPNWDFESAGVTYSASAQTPYSNGTTINQGGQNIVFCHSTQSRLDGCKNAK